MATQTKGSKPKEEVQKITSSQPVEQAEKEAQPIKQFITRFNNDWVMNFASGLAFNILTAIFPILIALLAIFGFVVGGLAPGSEQQLITGIQSVFPPQIQTGHLLQPVLNSLNKSAGLLIIIALLTAIFGGSRLFVTLEGYFDIMYHTRPRNVIRQNSMAFLMLLLFIVLVPIMVFGSDVPALVLSLLQSTPVSGLFTNGFVVTVLSFLVGAFTAWVLFEAIYIVVPNQHISFRNSWMGAVAAAVAVEIYLILFPFYVTHFMNSYTGTAGFAVILLFFFYYFAVILLLGAEVNAFFAEHVRATPADIPTMIHQVTSHLPTSEQAVEEQAAIDHKNEPPKEILPRGEARNLKQQAQGVTSSNGRTAGSQDQLPTHSDAEHNKDEKGKADTAGTSRRFTIVEVLAGTALAFVIELFRQRTGK